MPRNVREETELLLDRIDKSHPAIHKTVVETKETAALAEAATKNVQGAVAELRQTLPEVQEASSALEKCAESVTTTVREIQKFVPALREDASGAGSPADADAAPAAEVSPPAVASGEPVADETKPTEKRPPFSFQAITQSAEALGDTSGKLQLLLGDVRDLIDSQSLSTEVGALDNQYRGAVEAAGVRIEGVVDHVFKRAVQLFAVFFVLVVAYRLISRRYWSGPPAMAG